MDKFGVLEKQFDYKGHDCICIFNCLGYRCGYVSVDDYKDCYEAGRLLTSWRQKNERNLETNKRV